MSRYFWFCPDSPAETFHIDFRYGSDKSQLMKLMNGKYAYWMALGVREGHEDEWQKSITLFIGENFGTNESSFYSDTAVPAMYTA